jgi:diguanylate cyclase (GGDEF)-like protein/PAS domain S-box-containing protein
MTLSKRTKAKGPEDRGRALRQCEERLQSLLELSSDWYWEQDENCRFTLVIGTSVEHTGIEAHQYLGTARWDHGAVPVGDGGSWDKHKAGLKARQPFADFVFKRLNPRGEVRYISTTGRPVFDAKKRFKGYHGTARDITAGMRAEQLLRLEHAVNRSLAEADSVSAALTEVIHAICSTEGWECGRYFRVDEEAGVLRFGGAWGVPEDAIQQFIERSNQRSLEIVYQPGVGLMGQVWQTGEPLWVADVTKDARALRAAFTVDVGIRGGFVFPVKSEGKTIGVLTFNSREVRQPEDRLLQAIHVIGGQIGQFLQRKRAEEEQRRFRLALDNSADMIVLIDRKTMRFVDVNRTVCILLGYSREELLKMGPQDVLPESLDMLEHAYDEFIANPSNVSGMRSYYRCRDGSTIPFESTRHVLRSGDSHIIAAISRDVRERERADALMRLEHAVTRCLSEGDSLGAALKGAIRAICETENWECGRILRVDERAGVLRLGEAWGIQTDAIQRFLESSREVTYAPGAGLAGRVWQSGEPLWLPDIWKDSRAAQTPLIKQLGLHGAVFFPMMARDKMIGMLLFNSREVREPEERLLQTMRVIGSQIGQFLQRKQTEEVLRESEARFRSLTELSSDLYWEQDDQFRFTSMKGMGSERVNVGAGQPVVGRRRWEQEYINMTADDWPAHRATLEAHQPFHDLELCRPDDSGNKVWISVAGEPVFDKSGAFKGYRGVGKDITVRKLAEERVQYLAHHDELTALPNRMMFGEMLNFAIQQARRYNHKFAVLFIDLDRFKIINDTLGHEAGDKLLQEMGTRLTQTLRSSDVIARLGGDEFVVLVQEVGEPKQVEAVARKILSAVIKPMFIREQECRVTASIGICMFPADAEDEQSLMKNADIAMYRAKEEGKNTYQFFSQEMNVHSFERMALETSLRRGLERNEFFLHYQAKLDLQTARITGVEALVRWQHPDLGMIPPAQFIPLAEETGLIVPLGNWVLNTACAQNVAWQRAGLPPLRMAVNLSARQFADEDLLKDIAEALEKSGMKAELLELELTESMVMQNPERAGKVLAAIKQLGARLAIDDFGVGYSSLATLKRFPIDTLKVDRSFIRDIPQDLEDKAITRAIIAMGKSLNLTVVAEGVETLEQETFLRDHACDETQGFFFSRPIAQDQFAELLRLNVASYWK